MRSVAQTHTVRNVCAVDRRIVMRTYPPTSLSPEPLDGVALQDVPEEAGTRAAARAAVDGRRRGLRAILPFIGPAFIACVAYIDPGNCHQHPGGQCLRLQAAVGHRLGEPDGDAAANHGGEARPGNRPQPGRDVPAAVPQARRVQHVGCLRNHGDVYRSGGVSGGPVWGSISYSASPCCTRR